MNLNKKIYSILILSIILLNSCLVKEPEPRELTKVKSTNSGNGNDNLPYTTPNCQLINNKTIGSYSNFNITFTTVKKTMKSATVTMIEATNTNNDELTILINNFKDINANYAIVQSVNMKKNEAYIEMYANSLSQFQKYSLFSNVGTLHVVYDNTNKNWTLTFCECKFLDNPSGVNQYPISGKFLVN